MKAVKLVTPLLLATAMALGVSCANPLPETVPPVPDVSPANEAPIIAPMTTHPPGGLSGPGGTIIPGRVPERGNVYSVEIDLIPSRLVYRQGEEIQMELILTNTSRGEVEPVMVSPLPPEVNLVKSEVTSRQLAVVQASPGIAPGEPVKVFSAGTGEKRLTTGEKVTYSLIWDQRYKDGNQVSPGWYYYESSYSFRKESDAHSFGSGVRDRAFLIQYPQGVMTKTIEVNQSRTVTGLPFTNLNNETKLVDVVITLERIELNEMGATFYAMMTSPDNTVSGYKNPDWMGRIPLTSQYVVDGAVKEARAPNSKFSDNGVTFRWGSSADDDNYLDPVPADARELIFIIPEIGKWQGPWEFEVPIG